MNYSQQDFEMRFRRMEDYELRERLATGELTEAATAALKIVMCERGMLESDFDARYKGAKKAVYRRTGARNQCDYCQQSIRLFSAVKDAGQKFCSPECLRLARLMESSVDLDETDIASRALTIRNGPCPLCGRRDSPVEIRKHHWIWSAIIFARWGTGAKLCCKSCGNRENYRSIGSSLLLGWWCFPPGLLWTPIQMGANLVEVCRRDREAPSHDLIQIVKLQMAAALLASSRRSDG
jgi:hypothetical protein